MGEFLRVQKEEYVEYLEYLSKHGGGYTYKPVTISDCTLIYEMEDVEQKDKIGGRYFGGFPEIYEIRQDKLLEYYDLKKITDNESSVLSREEIQDGA